MTRQASLTRKTNETEIQLSWNLDGTGVSSINTTIPFLDHMLDLFTRHGHFDISLQAKGDTQIDFHHTVEDIGIVLGETFKKAVGDKAGIRRYGFFMLPMDEALAEIALDISNRAYLNFDVPKTEPLQFFDNSLFKEFFSAFVNHAGITLHVRIISGDNTHHIFEAIFKGLARALSLALQLDPRQVGIPSTKGML